MNLDFYNYLNNSILSKTIPHAFLIESNDVEKLIDDLISFLHEKKLIKKRNSLNNLNLILVEPDGKEIKKDSIIHLQNRYSKHPTDDFYNIYIIKNAELLNIASSNRLLKFLEEPPTNTIGFLLMDYGTNVLETIFSRCQHFIIKNSSNEAILKKEINELTEILFKGNNFYSLIKFKNKYKEYERKDLIIIFKETLKSIDQTINCDLSNHKSISKKIFLMDKLLLMLESNVNIDLLLDKLLIELR